MSITANATADACSSSTLSGRCSPCGAAAAGRPECLDGRTSPILGSRDLSLSGFSLDAYLIGDGFISSVIKSHAQDNENSRQEEPADVMYDEGLPRSALDNNILDTRQHPDDVTARSCGYDDVITTMHTRHEMDFVRNHRIPVDDDGDMGYADRTELYWNKYNYSEENDADKEWTESSTMFPVDDIDEFISSNLLPPPPVTHAIENDLFSKAVSENLFELIPPPLAFDSGYETETDELNRIRLNSTCSLEIASTEFSNCNLRYETMEFLKTNVREILEVDVPPPPEFSTEPPGGDCGPSNACRECNTESPQFQRKTVVEHFERLAATRRTDRDVVASRMHTDGFNGRCSDIKRSIPSYSIQRPSLPPPSPPCANVGCTIVQTSFKTNSSIDKLSGKYATSQIAIPRRTHHDVASLIPCDKSKQRCKATEEEVPSHGTIEQIKITLLAATGDASSRKCNKTIDIREVKNSPTAPSPPRRIGSIKMSSSGSFSNNYSRSDNVDSESSGIYSIPVVHRSSTLGRTASKKFSPPTNNGSIKSSLPVARANSSVAGKPTAQIRPNAIRSLSISSASGLNKYSQSMECLPQQALNLPVSNSDATTFDDLPNSNFDFSALRVNSRRGGQAANKTLSISKFGSLRSKIKDYVSSSSSSQSTTGNNGIGNKKQQSHPEQPQRPSQVLLPQTFAGYGSMPRNGGKEKSEKNKTVKSVTRAWEPRSSDYHKEDGTALVLTSPITTSPDETSPTATSPTVTSPVADPFSSYLSVAVPRPYSAELKHYGTLPSSLRKQSPICGTAIPENCSRQGTFKTFLGAREASTSNVNNTEKRSSEGQTVGVTLFSRKSTAEDHVYSKPSILERTPSLMSFSGGPATRKTARLKPTRSMSSSSSELNNTQKIGAGIPRATYTRMQTTPMSTFRTSGSIRYQAPNQQPSIPSGACPESDNQVRINIADDSIPRKQDRRENPIGPNSVKILPVSPFGSTCQKSPLRYRSSVKQDDSLSGINRVTADHSRLASSQIGYTRQGTNFEKDAKTFSNAAKRTSNSNIDYSGGTTSSMTSTKSNHALLNADSSSSFIAQNDIKLDCPAEATFEMVDRRVSEFMESLQNAFNTKRSPESNGKPLLNGSNHWTTGPGGWPSPQHTASGPGETPSGKKKNELAALTRRFVSDSQCVVSSATQSRELLVRSVASSVANLSSIVDECQQTTARMGATPHAVILVNRVRDLVGAYGATVRASRGAIGKSFGGEEMKLLMKHATSLAAILSSLIKLLVRYEFC